MKGAEIDPMTLVDPELRPAIALIQSVFPTEAGPDLVAELRRLDQAWCKPFQATPAVTRHAAPVPGAHDVTVYVINAEPGGARPAVLFLHGGGFVSGRAENAIADLQAQALALDCVIAIVGYRLAPETPFPGALEDNYSALLWLSRNSEMLGVDAERIAVQGHSAGAGHAAMLSIAARDRGEASIRLLVLSQAMLDDRTGSLACPTHVGTYLWTRPLNVAGWTALLGAPPDATSAPYGAVPARVPDLSGLPPTFIGIGALDLFVEENLAFASRLIGAGVATEVNVVPGAFHSFDMLAPESRAGRQYRLAILNALARAFGQPEFGSPPPTTSAAAAGLRTQD